MDTLRYYLGVAMQLTGIAGVLAGGAWAWLGVAQLPLFAIVDPLLGEDERERDVRSDALMDVPVVLCCLLGPIVLAVIAWRVGQGGLSAAEIAGMIATGAWLAVIPVVPAAHELYHKRSPWKYAIGTYTQVPYLDCTRSVAHMMGHHLFVGTPKDADTPIRGESMYGFLLRTIPANYAELYQMESDAARKWGRSVWSWQGRFTKAIAAYLAFLAATTLIGGWAGAAAVFAATVIARLWVEAFNYLQHCGLVRAEGEPVGPQHVWNHLSTLTRTAAFEITNHCEHHLDAYAPYHRMRPDADGPRMPSGFLCFLVALVPPLWNRLVLWPRLREWDRRHATPAERALAREANRRAGWPDWLSDASDEPEASLA
ncbi:MAG: fatty acid desaturase [Candidatus Binatia bacterium]